MDARTRSTLVWFAGVTLAAGLVTLVALGGGELRPHDEGLYGKLARNALAHGTYAHAVDAAGAYTHEFSKPPLSIWLVAASFELLGYSLWALRLPFALGSIGAAWVCFFWGTRMGGPRLGGLWALALVASAATLRWGRAACIEPLFVAFCLLGLAAYGQALAARGRAAVGWAALAGVGLALAVMTKQLAVGLAVLPIVALEVVRRDGWRVAGSRLAVALAIPAATLATWFALAYARVGPPLWEAYVDSSVVARLGGYASGRHQRALNEVGALVAEVVAPFPWVPALGGLALWMLATRLRERAAGERPGQAWLLAGFFVTAVLLYENVSRTLLPWYVYALVPPLAGGVAWTVHAALAVAERPDEAGPDRAALRAGAVAGALTLLVAAVAALAPAVSQLDVALAAVVAIAAVAGGRWLSRGPAVLVALGFAALAVGISLAPNLHEKPGRYEVLMTALGERGVGAVAVDPETGIGGNQYGTFFGPGADRVKRPPWASDEPGAWEAYVTEAIPPEEFTPPAGVELVRAPGAVAWLGDLGRAPFAIEALRRLLDAGAVTFEAEHLHGSRPDTLAAGGRAFAPWNGAAVERFVLVDGPQLAFPPGRYEVKVRARWDCDGLLRRVASVEALANDDRRAQADIACEAGGPGGEWAEVALPVTLGQGARLRVRVIYERGALEVDRVAVARTLVAP